MNRFRPSRRLPAIAATLALAGLLASPAAAQPAGGSIVGTVTSTGTQNALQGALVSLPAFNRTELTDNTGGFALGNVPPGAVELVVSYIGFNDERRTVTVRAGEAARLEVTLRPTPAITMDAFTVAAEREGHALSVTEQRNAENIKNVTAIDAWGNMPNMSVGELAMRLPGMTFQLDSDDVVMNVSNILETGPSFYRYVPERVRELRTLPAAVTFGVNGQF